jgi:subtilisin family serine protease
MKINLGGAPKLRSLAFVSTCLLISTSSMTSAALVDPSLENWSAMPTAANFSGIQEKQVIVFLKPSAFKNRTGFSHQMALFQERRDSMNFLKEKAKEISTFASQPKADYLWSSNAMILSIDRAGLKKLSNRSDIDGIIENRIVTLDRPIMNDVKTKADESSMSYGLQMLHVTEAWNRGLTGEGVVVGVIDTGVDETHPDLVGKILLQKDFTADNNNKDCYGHGTHVSGTIVGGHESGVAIGVAPGAKIIMAKVLDCEGSGTLANILKAMEWMLDPDGNPNTNDAPKIVSNSWGGSNQFIYGFRNAVRSWRRFGILPSFAAGNSGDYYFTVNAPGSYPFSYTVGAVDENMDVTYFSSRGPTIWWKNFYPVFYKKPNISAPGLDVLSAIPENSVIGEELKSRGKGLVQGKWARLSGTSMATPHLSAVAALALQANPNLSVEDLAEILNSTALDHNGKGRNNSSGNGIVQVDQVIGKAKSWQVSSPSSFQDKDPSLWEWETP